MKRTIWTDEAHAVDDGEWDEGLIDPCNKFPAHIMRGWDRDFVELYADRLESPPQFFWGSYMACVGAIVAPKIRFDLAINTPIRVYILLLGESADSRKSTAMEQTEKLFLRAYDGKFCFTYGVNSGVGLRQVLEKQPSTILDYDEFRQFLKVSSYSNSDLLDLVTQLYSRDVAESHKSDNHVVIRNVHLSLLAACTLKTYSHVYDGDAIDIGFSNRVFIIPGRRTERKPFPRSFGDTELAPLLNAITKIEAIPAKTYSPTQNAVKIFSDWYRGYEISDFSKRIEDYAMRFMTLLAVVRGESVVTDTIVLDTIDLINWQIKMRSQYDPVDADGMLAKMEGKIVGLLRSNETVSYWDLFRKTGARRCGIEVFDRALNTLVEHEIISGTRQKNYKTKSYKLLYDTELTAMYSHILQP